MKNYLLGIDIGTSSIKATAIDGQARTVAAASAGYHLREDQPGWRQIDTGSMWNGIFGALSNLGQKIDLSQVGAIGLSCLCPGLAAFDSTGAVLVDPIIYSDQRSAAEAKEISQKVDSQTLFSLAANLPMPGAMSATSMLWIKHHLPTLYLRTFCFGHINTLLAVELTGNFAIDRSNASYTLLFDTAGTLTWSQELCRQIGIPLDKLPPILSSAEPVGPLRRGPVTALGLTPGIPVIIGGGDTACAALACGVVRDGDVCESIGTTDVLTVCTSRPVFRREFINRCHVADGTWIYQGAMSHIGSSLSWCRDVLCPDLCQGMDTDPFDVLTDRAGRLSCPGANGVVFLPYMMGERSPVWDPKARGVFFGLSLNSTRDDLVRAVLESSGYGLRQMMALAQEITGHKITAFSAIGGGSRSDIWGQIKADITGADIAALQVKDMAPVGAALLAGVGSGVFSDVFDAASRVRREVRTTFFSRPGEEAYDRRFHTYLQLYPSLKSLY